MRASDVFAPPGISGVSVETRQNTERCHQGPLRRIRAGRAEHDVSDDDVHEQQWTLEKSSLQHEMNTFLMYVRT